MWSWLRTGGRFHGDRGGAVAVVVSTVVGKPVERSWWRSRWCPRSLRPRRRWDSRCGCRHGGRVHGRRDARGAIVERGCGSGRVHCPRGACGVGARVVVVASTGSRRGNRVRRHGGDDDGGRGTDDGGCGDTDHEMAVRFALGQAVPDAIAVAVALAGPASREAPTCPNCEPPRYRHVAHCELSRALRDGPSGLLQQPRGRRSRTGRRSFGSAPGRTLRTPPARRRGCGWRRTCPTAPVVSGRATAE